MSEGTTPTRTATRLDVVETESTTRRRRPPKFLRSVPMHLARLLLAVVVLGIWELTVRTGVVDPFFVSSPVAIWQFLVGFVSSGEIWRHLWFTLQATVVGFVFGSAAGVLAGVLLARYERVNRLFDPLLTILNSLPRVALAPLFLLWFGLGITSKIALAVSLVFFILLINTRGAIKSVDADIVTVSRLLGGNERQLFLKVILPAAVPGIAAGLHLAVIYSLLGVVVGEMIASEAGLGQRIAFYSGQFNTAGVLGVLAVLALIAALMNASTVAAERRLLRYQDRGRL